MDDEIVEALRSLDLAREKLNALVERDRVLTITGTAEGLAKRLVAILGQDDDGNWLSDARGEVYFRGYIDVRSAIKRLADPNDHGR